MEGKIQTALTCRSYKTIFIHGASESVPTCFLFFLEALSGLSQGYNCGSGLFVDTFTGSQLSPCKDWICLLMQTWENVVLVNVFPQERSTLASARNYYKSGSSACITTLPCAIILLLHPLHNQTRSCFWEFAENLKEFAFDGSHFHQSAVPLHSAHNEHLCFVCACMTVALKGTATLFPGHYLIF